jgi:hypothetical protein
MGFGCGLGIEHLLSLHKALVSIPSTTLKKKKKKSFSFVQRRALAPGVASVSSQTPQFVVCLGQIALLSCAP